MNKRPDRILLAILEYVNLIIREENSIAIFHRREIDAQVAGDRKRFMPGLNFLRAVRLIVRRLLHKGRGLVPGLGVFLLHGLDELFGGGDFSGERLVTSQQNYYT